MSRGTASSAPRSTWRSSLTACLPRPTRRETTTVAGPPPASKVAPTSNRWGSSLPSSTTNAPSTPCGRPTRPTRTTSRLGSVGNLEQVALFGPGPCRADDAPEGSSDAALPADDLAHVVGRDVEMEDDCVLALLRLDANGARLGDEPARDPFEKLSHRGRRPS